MEIKYLGHSAFEINTNGHKILIDPFLVCAPNYKAENISDIFKKQKYPYLLIMKSGEIVNNNNTYLEKDDIEQILKDNKVI